MRKTYTQQDIITELGFINFQIEMILALPNEKHNSKTEHDLELLLANRKANRKSLLKLAKQA